MTISRRALMQTAVALAAGSALPTLLRAQNDASVITKAIPSSGERIPVIGIGTNDLGMGDYAAARNLLRRLHELGGAVIDTAAEYGQSEVLIGRALAELGITQQMFIATKFNDAHDAAGRPPPGSKAAQQPPDPISGVDSVNRSLQRMQKVDLLFVHHMTGIDSMMPIAMDLQKQGRVRYIGFTSVGQRNPEQVTQVLDYMRKYPVDFLQIDYSLGNRYAEETIFPLAQRRKIAIMAAEALTEPVEGGVDHVDRSSLFKRVEGHALPDWAAGLDIKSWSQLFLKYAASHPAVTCVVAGATKLSHLEDNQGAALGRLPNASDRRKMERLWQELIKQ